MSASAAEAGGKQDEVNLNNSESEWLVSCCAEALGCISSWRHRPCETLDWERILILADRHDVIPLVHAGLSQPGGAPPWFVRKIADRSRQITSWNLQLATEAASLDESFRTAGIRPIFFKGPVLAQQLYGSLALRQCRDVDLLVERKDVPTAAEVLLQRGFLIESSAQADGNKERLASFKDWVFLHPESGVLVELHWAICEPAFDRQLHLQGVDVRRQFIPFFGRFLHIPVAEDLVFLLCIHGARHYWGSLKWICDIARILQACPGLDWRDALKVAQKFDRTRTVLLGLRLAHVLFDVSLPKVASSLMEQHLVINVVADQTCGFLFSKDHFLFPHGETPLLESKPAAETDIVRKLFRVRSLDNLSSRRREVVRVIRNFLKPDPEDLRKRPKLSKWWPLFWVIQPFRMIRSYGLLFFFRISLQFVKSLAR